MPSTYRNVLSSFRADECVGTSRGSHHNESSCISGCRTCFQSPCREEDAHRSGPDELSAMLLADAESCYSEEMAPASQSVTPSLSPSPPPPLPPQASTAARWTDLVPPHCQRCHLYTGSGNKGECVLCFFCFFLSCCESFLKRWKSWDRPFVLAISLFVVSEADRPCVDTCVTPVLSSDFRIQATQLGIKL